MQGVGGVILGLVLSYYFRCFRPCCGGAPDSPGDSSLASLIQNDILGMAGVLVGKAKFAVLAGPFFDFDCDFDCDHSHGIDTKSAAEGWGLVEMSGAAGSLAHAPFCHSEGALRDRRISFSLGWKNTVCKPKP